MDNTDKKLADAQQQIALLKRVLLDLGESAAREICVPFEECIGGPIGRAREMLAGFVPELGKPMGMIPISVGRPAFENGERVIVHTEGVDFAGQQYFHIKAEDLWEPDPKQMSQVAAAATHWMHAPQPSIAAEQPGHIGSPVSPIPSEQAEVRRMFFKALDYLRKNKIANFPEGTVEINGAFKRFMDSDTDSAWLGFRIALQAARKLATRTLLPMDSAPLDGTEVVLRVKARAGCRGKYLVGHYMPGGHCIDDHPPIAPGWYFWNGCEFDYAAEPEGWMPLPIEETTTHQDKA